jgi:hypothetical protein
VKYRVEIKESKLLANSVVVTIRLHVLDPISGEWDWQDGIGATPLQTAKEAGAIEFDKIKSAAVQMGAPAAESMAVKDAAEKFGKLFGKDLGRKEILDYAPMQEAKSNALGPVPEELAVVIEEIGDEDTWENIWKNNPSYHANRDFMTRMKTRRQTFTKKEAPHE